MEIISSRRSLGSTRDRETEREREREGGGGSYATWISVSQEVAEGWGIPGEARHQVSASLGPIARRPRQEKKGSSWKEQKRRLPCRAGCACRGPRRGERGRLAKLRVRINRVTLLPPSLPPSPRLRVYDAAGYFRESGGSLSLPSVSFLVPRCSIGR